MQKKDDFICSMINSVIRFTTFCSIKKMRLLRQSRNKYRVNSDDLFIVLNGPSVNKQNLELLVGKQLMFVNRGFKHPLYSALKPTYHFFVDNKMLTGEWPLSWLDEIVLMNPNVIFIMPVSWALKPMFRPYIDKGYNFYWIPMDTPAYCYGVAGYCFDFAIRRPFRRIYFTGFDATGLANEVLHSTSHFYGVNEENNLKTTKEFARDFYMFSRHLSDIRKIAEKSKRAKNNIINITDGGLMDMFPRENYNDVLKCKG